MKIDATADEIRALVHLAELDQRSQQLSADAYRRSRDAAQRRVPRLLLDRYRSRLEGGRQPVVATIERGTCSGCHVRLPTMVEARTRRKTAVHTCPHCRRMLYVPELLDAGAAAVAEEEAPARRAARPAAGDRS